MRHLYIFCEGPTEQRFCSQVLSPYLFPNCEGWIHTIKIANSRHHGVVSRGGINKYAALKRDVLNTLKQHRERNVYFTSMIDLYALPGEFPGKGSHVRNPVDPEPYVTALESAFAADLGDSRFVPYLQLHEYETMLFSDPEAFRIAFDDCDKAIEALKAIVESVTSIEHIDDGPSTAPSKRIISVLPAYEGRKSSAGPDIAQQIGVNKIRVHCPHFGQWLKRLENLDWSGA